MFEHGRRLILIGPENLIMFYQSPNISLCFSTHIHPVSCLYVHHSLPGLIFPPSVLFHVTVLSYIWKVRIVILLNVPIAGQGPVSGMWWTPLCKGSIFLRTFPTKWIQMNEFITYILEAAKSLMLSF